MQDIHKPDEVIIVMVGAGCEKQRIEPSDDDEEIVYLTMPNQSVLHLLIHAEDSYYGFYSTIVQFFKSILKFKQPKMIQKFTQCVFGTIADIRHPPLNVILGAQSESIHFLDRIQLGEMIAFVRH